jgi:electron transport complex protein RnfG
MAVKSNLTNMVLVLGVTCLVCSALLGGAYALTKDPIDKAAAAKTEKAIAQVLPHFTEVQYNQEGRYYTATDGDAVVGYAIESSTVGFGGTLTLMVGVTPDGVVYNTSVLSHSETPGLGAKCTTDEKFMNQWKGFDASVKKLYVTKDGGDVDAITASTITSRAYAQAVANALVTFDEIVGPAEEAVEAEIAEIVEIAGGQDYE